MKLARSIACVALLAVCGHCLAADPPAAGTIVSPFAPRKCAGYVGYRGDGTGVYRDCHPPLEFAYPGKNIRWEVPLPAWGHGSPIVVADRVFVVCEVGATNDWPLLVCLDARTGRTLWQRELDHLPVLVPDAAQRQALRADWHSFREDVHRLKRSMARDDGDTDEPLREKDAPDESIRDVVRAAAWKARQKRLTSRGLWPETWNEALFHNASLACIGYGFATPVSDGQRVYAVTSFGGFFAFDLDGGLRWMAAVPCRRPANLQHFGSIEHCQNGRSPLLYKDMLISDITGYVRAFDRETGAVRWTDDGPARAKSHTIVSPAVMRVGGTDILWAAGCCAYRLPDGKRLTVEGWKDEGMQTLVKYDEPDVVFFCGAGEHCGWTGKGGLQGQCEFNPPAAVRFTLDGDTLRAKVLWHGGTLAEATGEDRAVLGGNAPWMLYHDGKFYHRGGAILDAATGKVLAGKFSRQQRAVPQTRHLQLVAGEHVFGLGKADRRDGASAVMEVFTLDGRPVARNLLAAPKLTDEQRRMFACSAGVETPREFSYGWTFTFAEDRIYIRSYGNLICVGR